MAVERRGQLPKAYLRFDPNLDATHPAPGDMVALLCAANRQPRRGHFKSEALASRVLGRRLYQRSVDRGDLVMNGAGMYVDGWAEWQEGDLTVGERMRNLRVRKASGLVPSSLSDGARRTANWRLRNLIYERDRYTCRYCGVHDYQRDWLVLEHVIPGGPTDEGNLVTACRPCNKRKGPRTPDEAGMPLLPVPSDASP